MTVYLNQLVNKYSSVDKVTNDNKFIPQISDIEAAYTGSGGLRSSGMYVFDLRDNNTRQLMSSIIDELRKAPILKKIKDENYMIDAVGAMKQDGLGIVLTNGEYITIKYAQTEVSSVYFNKYKLYAPITNKFLISDADNIKLHKIPCKSINEFLKYQQEFLDMKAIPIKVEYSNSLYYTSYIINESYIGKQIGLTTDDSNYKVYELNSESAESNIALKVSDNPEVFIEAHKSN